MTQRQALLVAAVSGAVGALVGAAIGGDRGVSGPSHVITVTPVPAIVAKLDSSHPSYCGARGPVTCDLRQGRAYCVDGGTCGFWVDAADVLAIAAEAKVDPATLRLDMRGGKLVALP